MGNNSCLVECLPDLENHTAHLRPGRVELSNSGSQGGRRGDEPAIHHGLRSRIRPTLGIAIAMYSALLSMLMEPETRGSLRYINCPNFGKKILAEVLPGGGDGRFRDG